MEFIVQILGLVVFVANAKLDFVKEQSLPIQEIHKKQAAFNESKVVGSPIQINRIIIEGLERTRPSVIYTELRFGEKMAVEPQLIDLSLADLRNMNLFSKVEFEQTKNADETVDLKIQLTERWTTIPILKFSSGGGINRTTVGLYDPNIFGTFTESGAQFESFSGANSYIAWLKKPRLFSTRNGLDLQYWDTSRQRAKYDSTATDPIVVNGFLQKRRRLVVGFNYEYSPYLLGGLFYEHHKDEFSRDLLDDEIKAISLTIPLPSRTQFDFFGARLTLGRIEEYNAVVNGLRALLSVQKGISRNDSAKDFWQTDITIDYYKTLGRFTFAQRGLMGTTTTDAIQYWFYLGGLDRIRGFSDNRFAGRNFLLSNSELRYVAHQTSWSILQTVVFSDILNVSERSKNIFDVSAASIGGGVRIILPKFYKLAFRFDIAEPIKKNDDIKFSFGVQQFF